jgi:peroxiredoxin
MKKLSTVAILLALSCVVALAAVKMSNTSSARDEKTAAVALGAVVPDFTLPDADGQDHTLASLKGKSATVLIFIATRCPVSNGYNERMKAIAADYAARGVNVVGINANSTEPIEEVKQHAADKGFRFAVLKDKGNVIADRFDAQVTPEAYLLDANGKLVYHGAIDNSRAGDAITSNYLRDAIDAVLAGKAVAKQEAKAFGCSIKRG